MSFIANLAIMLAVMTHGNFSIPSDTHNHHVISAIPFFRRVGYDDPYCNSSINSCSTSRFKYKLRDSYHSNADLLSAFYGRTNLPQDIPGNQTIRHDNTTFAYNHCSNEHQIDMKLFTSFNYEGVIADDLNHRVQGGNPLVQGRGSTSNGFNYDDDDRPSSLDVTAADYTDGHHRDPMSSVQHHASISPL